ncbi:hypothetical protein K493DRAFT_381261 [Basidiobolus meristosporus CBS 931.73]|uniref:Arrestin C-terminal-like domain-containing protein n=1 Tax=Basidiobolus meristosporus CBS 931.73 TaxID=1314790 RepID=A0A1Y1XWR3_9FUNG|nr:hypothetical protein K493DRAFT_381261 [Basidiobolus meristosporus CBS 931.73]|eukprot:ORX90172.1 hypothetical protein K493DRAFT_381261 [Basidiobolus meristosporus CBS 931.73]
MALAKVLNLGFEVLLERDTILNGFDVDTRVNNYIRGKVLLHPKIRTNLTELNLVLEGKFSVQSLKGFKRIEKIIIEQKVTLSEPQTEGVPLTPTCHEYPFELCLPGDLPPSFRGNYGQLTYTVRALGTLSSHWSLSYIKAERDLQIFRDMRPLYDTYRTQLSGNWMDSIEYNASFSTNTYKPGDVIPITFKYHVKDQNIRINHIIAFLRESSVYRMPSDEHTSGHIIREDRETIDLNGDYSEGFYDGECQLDLQIPTNLLSYDCLTEYGQITHKISFRIDYVLNGSINHFSVAIPVAILPTSLTELLDTHVDEQLPMYDVIAPPPSYCQIEVS